MQGRLAIAVLNINLRILGVKEITQYFSLAILGSQVYWSVPVCVLITDPSKLVILDYSLHNIQLSLDTYCIFLTFKVSLVKEVKIFLPASNVK